MVFLDWVCIGLVVCCIAFMCFGMGWSCNWTYMHMQIFRFLREVRSALYEATAMLMGLRSCGHAVLLACLLAFWRIDDIGSQGLLLVA
jgi:hypothetical protein